MSSETKEQPGKEEQAENTTPRSEAEAFEQIMGRPISKIKFDD